MRLIDADAMMKRLEEWNTSDFMDKALYNFALMRIIEQPAIKPERKKGKWILVTDNNGQHFICDHCGEWRYRQNQKFCGECGADMREGEQE